MTSFIYFFSIICFIMLCFFFGYRQILKKHLIFALVKETK